MYRMKYDLANQFSGVRGKKRLQDAVRSELIHTKHKNRKSKNNKAPKIGARKEFT